MQVQYTRKPLGTTYLIMLPQRTATMDKDTTLLFVLTFNPRQITHFILSRARSFSFHPKIVSSFLFLRSLFPLGFAYVEHSLALYSQPRTWRERVVGKIKIYVTFSFCSYCSVLGIKYDGERERKRERGRERERERGRERGWPRPERIFCWFVGTRKHAFRYTKRAPQNNPLFSPSTVIPTLIFVNVCVCM